MDKSIIEINEGDIISFLWSGRTTFGVVLCSVEPGHDKIPYEPARSLTNYKAYHVKGAPIILFLSLEDFKCYRIVKDELKNWSIKIVAKFSDTL